MGNLQANEISGGENFWASRAVSLPLLSMEHAWLTEPCVELGWQPVAKQKNFNVLILLISTFFWSFLHFLLVRPDKGSEVWVATINSALKDGQLPAFLPSCFYLLIHQVLHLTTICLTRSSVTWVLLEPCRGRVSGWQGKNQLSQEQGSSLYNEYF